MCVVFIRKKVRKTTSEFLNEIYLICLLFLSLKGNYYVNILRYTLQNLQNFSANLPILQKKFCVFGKFAEKILRFWQICRIVLRFWQICRIFSAFLANLQKYIMRQKFKLIYKYKV